MGIMQRQRQILDWQAIQKNCLWPENAKMKTKVLFIHPNPRPGWTKERALIWYPIGLAYVVDEVRRANYDFTILDYQVNSITDDQLRHYLEDNKYDVVGIGALSNSYYIVKPLIEIVREMLPNALIVGGNSVASARPELFVTKTRADVAIVGEGAKTFVEILKRVEANTNLSGVDGIVYLQNGEIIKESPRTPLKVLDERPFPKWDMFDVDAYIQSANKHKNVRLFSYLKEVRPFMINTSLGCPFRCTFCYNSMYYKSNPLRFHSPEVLIGEIRHLKERFNINFLLFIDELTWTTAKQAEPLVDALIEADLGIEYEASVRVGFLRRGNEEFAKKLKKSGCKHLSYSLESGSPKILKAMNKGINAEGFHVQKKILDEAGIISTTSVVLGFPGETVDTVNETFKVCYDSDIYPSVGFLTPLPGSVVYEQLISNGTINDEEKYFLSLGDRQYMNLNLSCMSKEVFESVVFENLKKIRDKLGLEISDEQLICHTIIKRDDEENGNVQN